MLNAIQPESYVRPHKHKDKIEMFIHLKGSFLVVEFDEKGKIKQKIKLNQDNKAVDFIADVYHTIIALEPDSVVLEVIEGPYTEEDHKIFPEWAPEDHSSGMIFIKNLNR